MHKASLCILGFLRIGAAGTHCVSTFFYVTITSDYDYYYYARFWHHFFSGSFHDIDTIPASTGAS